MDIIEDPVFHRKPPFSVTLYTAIPKASGIYIIYTLVMNAHNSSERTDLVVEKW